MSTYAEEAERRDEEKERRWGPGWRKNETGVGTGRGGGGGGKDRKGFYKLLGLQSKMGSATLVRVDAGGSGTGRLIWETCGVGLEDFDLFLKERRSNVKRGKGSGSR